MVSFPSLYQLDHRNLEDYTPGLCRKSMPLLLQEQSDRKNSFRAFPYGFWIVKDGSKGGPRYNFRK
jgi:hypothetical protein